jgi:DNA-directed RNA polymerase subunit delta
MSSQYTLKISEEQAKEMPMVDLAFEVLKAANNPFYYRDLMKEIAKIKGLSDEEVMQVIAQLYTEINIDGRFACVGNNLWGLKRWYPVEKSDDAVGNAKYPRIINDDDDDDDYFAEEEETYAEGEDFENFDGEDAFSTDDEFYEDEDVIDDAEIDEVEGEIDEIEEEPEEDFEDTDEEEDPGDDELFDDDDDK